MHSKCPGSSAWAQQFCQGQQGEGCNGLRIHRDLVAHPPSSATGEDVHTCGHSARALSFWLAWVFLQWTATRASGGLRGCLARRDKKILWNCFFQLLPAPCQHLCWAHLSQMQSLFLRARSSRDCELLWGTGAFASFLQNQMPFKLGFAYSSVKEQSFWVWCLQSFPTDVSSLSALIWKSFLKKYFSCCLM